MLRIYKYPLELLDTQTVEMPEGARILSVHDQRGVLTLWALVQPDKPPTKYSVRIYGTGNPIPDDAWSLFFVGSVLQFSGGLVWHVFIAS